MDKIKVLFIDDIQSAVDNLIDVFQESGYFELVKKNAIFDEGSIKYQDREQQKRIIIKLLKEESYDLVLLDLTLRRRTETDVSPGMAAEEFLSVEIYSEMKDWFKENNKKFVFVTSHAEWFSESRFRSIGESVEGSYFMRKANDKQEYFACRHLDKKREPKCGRDKCTVCSSYECFNELLRRIAEE